MTAIAAVVAADLDIRAALNEMQARLEPFGGDRSRAWADTGAGLAVCQRHTLPEDIHDREPELVDGVVLVADVRLDNRDELARTLAIETGALREMSDSALLRRAWSRWSTSCTEHLVGEFAFAVWSARDRVLFAARDPVGLRSLCYARLPRGLALASMPAALAGVAGVSSALDPIRIAQRLSGAPPEADRTYFEGVSRLPPGHTLTAAGDRMTVSPYFSWGRRRIRYSRPDDYVEHFREVFDAAVRSCLRASVPVGSLLSGGLDSGAVTATAALALRQTGQRLPALTWRPRAGAASPVDGRVIDETGTAARIGSLHANVDHISVDAPATWVIDPLQSVGEAGEPMRALVNGAYFSATSDAVRGQGFVALLCGQFGNFTVSYPGGETTLQWLRSVLGYRWRHRHGALWTGALSAGFAHRYRDHLGDRVPLRDSVAERARTLHWNDPGAVNAALSAAFGFELRDPTADSRVVDFCLSIPDEEFRRGDDQKRLVRRAMRGRVPDTTLDAATRGMQSADWPRFVVPYREDFRRLLAEIERSPLASQAIDVGRVRRMLEEWPAPRHENRSRYLNMFVRACTVGDFIVRHEKRGATSALN